MKLWLEMSRDETHGGGAWDFKKCLWSPTRKRTGERWAHWETVAAVQASDLVLHLRGKTGSVAEFVGWSSAATDGEETTERPPEPGSQWEYSRSFYRVKLRDFTPLARPIPLKEVFAARQTELLAYFERNKRSKARLRLFYVWQAGRLQCFNGGYCSNLDNELVELLIGDSLPDVGPEVEAPQISPAVTTGARVCEVARRIGQEKFARQVKSNFGDHCCFPECEISGSAFLVAGHIARWADHLDWRGEIANGLCLCPLHDRAFELGLFTITADHCIHIHEARCQEYHWAPEHFRGAHGLPIRASRILPARAALQEHWRRHGIKP